MEKRRSKRKHVSLEAEFISNSINYHVFIENISEYGLHMITASKKSVASFIPEIRVDLKFKASLGRKTNLHCEVKWVHINKTPIHGLTYRMGMEIIAPPPKYKKYFKTL